MRCFAKVSILTILFWAAATGPGAPFGGNGAPGSVVGTYRNLSYNVDGAGGQNRFMPPLELRADGTYQWGRESGKYDYRDGKVFLSGSYAAWGPGKVDKDFKLWFEFTKSGKHFTVTMYRVAEK